MHCHVCINCYGTGYWVTPPPPISRFRNNLCKDDSALFSRFLHAQHTPPPPPPSSTVGQLNTHSGLLIVSITSWDGRHNTHTVGLYFSTMIARNSAWKLWDKKMYRLRSIARTDNYGREIRKNRYWAAANSKSSAKQGFRLKCPQL